MSIANLLLTDDCANYNYVAVDREHDGEPRALELAPFVFEEYETYRTRVFDPTGPVPHATLPTVDHEVLRVNSSYLSRAYFYTLRRDIFDTAPARKCPYCYQRKATQVDHFLPRSKFGEYSIFAPNLVPICGECNTRKSNRFTRAGGGRRYLHPYFDRLPNEGSAYLTAQLFVGSNIQIAFDIVRPIDIGDEEWAALNAQFDDLDLRISYMEDAVQAMMSMLGAFYAHFARGGFMELQKQMRIEHTSRFAWYGTNHWWPVMLDTLASSTDFCAGGFRTLGPEPDY